MKAARNGSLHKNVTAQRFWITDEMRIGNLSNRLYANDNPPYFIYEIKTITYDVIDVNIFHLKLMRFRLRKEDISVPIILLQAPIQIPEHLFPKCSYNVISTSWILVNLQ